MLRLASRRLALSTTQPINRVGIRHSSHGHGPELGPAEPLFYKSTYAWVGLGSLFLGLWYYDGVSRLDQSKVSGTKSVIGEKIDSFLSFLKPSEGTLESRERTRWEKVVNNQHEGERHRTLFTPNRKPDLGLSDPMPVPETPRRGVELGRVILDIDAIEPRKVKGESFKPLPEDFRKKQLDEQYEEYKKRKAEGRS